MVLVRNGKPCSPSAALDTNKMSFPDVSVLKLLNKQLASKRQSSHDDHDNLFALFTFLESRLFFNSVAVLLLRIVALY